jgi:hypothetical protein
VEPADLGRCCDASGRRHGDSGNRERARESGGKRSARQAAAEEPLDLPQLRPVLRRHERNRFPFAAHPTGAPDPVREQLG